MLKRYKKFVFIALLAFAGGAIAQFSRFVVITPANEAEYPLLIQVEAVPGHGGRSRVRVIGDIGDYQSAWLVVCRTSVCVEKVNLRDVFWFDAENEHIDAYVQLFPEKIRVPGWRGHLYPYVEVELSPEQMRRALIYIDFPHPVDDGGYYYAIDLAYYLEGELGKKIEIQWGAQ